HRAGCDVKPVRRWHEAVRNLAGEFDAGADITECAKPRRAADWHHPRISSPQVLSERVQPLLVRPAVANERSADLQVHAQRAGRRWRRHLVRKKTDAGKAESSRVERSSQRMMRSDGAEGRNALAVFLPRPVKDVLEFADLVSAVDVPCQVVQLDGQPVPVPGDVQRVLAYRGR